MNGLSLLVLHRIVLIVYTYFKAISAQAVLCALVLCAAAPILFLLYVPYIHTLSYFCTRHVVCIHAVFHWLCAPILFVARGGVCLYCDVRFHCVAVYFVCMLCKCLKFYLFCALSWVRLNSLIPVLHRQLVTLSPRPISSYDQRWHTHTCMCVHTDLDLYMYVRTCIGVQYTDV